MVVLVWKVMVVAYSINLLELPSHPNDAHHSVEDLAGCISNRPFLSAFLVSMGDVEDAAMIPLLSLFSNLISIT